MKDFHYFAFYLCSMLSVDYFTPLSDFRKSLQERLHLLRYFVARISSVTHSPVRCLQSPCRFAPSSWTAVAWTVPSSHDNFSLVIESISILAVARSQSNFTSLVFLGVLCIGRTSASTSLLRSSYKQCYAFRMK